MNCKYYPNICPQEKYFLLVKEFCKRNGTDCMHKERLDNLATEYKEQTGLELISLGRKA